MAPNAHLDDIPYGEDWSCPTDVARWVEAADQKRPWRAKMREAIAQRVAELPPPIRILELGSGPGLLAECILRRCPTIRSYTLLDFSEPMHALSRQRLAPWGDAQLDEPQLADAGAQGARSDVTRFVLASFKSARWLDYVSSPFDCVVTMQAVHELRHKRHAAGLYCQIHQVLRPGGCALICDHLPIDDSPKNRALLMTEHEQHAALLSAGLCAPQTVLSLHGLNLYVSVKPD